MPTWVITGANRGLGLEFVAQLTSDSANTIIATSRSLRSDLSELEALKSASESLHIAECDVSNLDSIAAFAQEVGRIIGPDGKVDFLLNNAGINSVPRETSLSITPDGLLDQVKVNVLGPAKTTEFVVPYLARGAVVMNMTSGLGSVALAKQNGSSCTTYSISKAALNMLTMHQSLQLKDKGIWVVCMDPGWVKTRMGGANALLEKEDSIRGMLKVIKAVDEKDTGTFFEHNGKEKPW